MARILPYAREAIEAHILETEHGLLVGRPIWFEELKRLEEIPVGLGKVTQLSLSAGPLDLGSIDSASLVVGLEGNPELR